VVDMVFQLNLIQQITALLKVIEILKEGKDKYTDMVGR
jgi:hypothetical protein